MRKSILISCSICGEVIELPGTGSITPIIDAHLTYGCVTAMRALNYMNLLIRHDDGIRPTRFLCLVCRESILVQPGMTVEHAFASHYLTGCPKMSSMMNLAIDFDGVNKIEKLPCPFCGQELGLELEDMVAHTKSCSEMKTLIETCPGCNTYVGPGYEARQLHASSCSKLLAMARSYPKLLPEMKTLIETCPGCNTYVGPGYEARQLHASSCSKLLAMARSYPKLLPNMERNRDQD
jgi:hypothetical protein